MTPEVESATVAKALAHQSRITILELLKGGTEMSPSMMAATSGEPLGNMSYHVKILRGLGAVEETRTSPVRGALEHFYKSTGKVSLMSDANIALDAIATVLRAEGEADVALEKIRDVLSESGREAEFAGGVV
jgi:DNA-binding transcriptional ArsR family regulator